MFETVFRGRTQSEADLAISLLRSMGLHPMDLQTSPHITLAGAELSYRVEVPEAEAAQARQILTEAGYANR